MVTVINAGALAGYSGMDHLIEDETSEIIGQKYRCVGDALRAADKHCHIARHGQYPRRAHPYTWVEVQMANGKTYRHTSV